MIGKAKQGRFTYEMDDEGQWRALQDEASVVATELNAYTKQVIRQEYSPSKGERFLFGFLRTVEDLDLEELEFIPPPRETAERVY